MRRTLRKLLFLLLALALLAALLYRFRGSIKLEGFRWSLLLTSVRDARISLLLLSIGIIYLCYGVRALRWMRLSQALGPSTFPHVLSGTIMGFTAVFLLGRAGEPIRPLLIARKDELPIAGSFGIYVIERITDISATAIVTAFALVFLPAEFSGIEEAGPLLTAARTAGISLLVGVFAAIAFLVYFRLHGAGALEPRLATWRAHGGGRAKFATLVAGFSDGLQAIRTWGDLMAAIGYTVLHWILILLIYVWIPHSFGGDFLAIDLRGAMLLFAFTLAGSALQLPGVGGGTQVASFLVFSVIFGVEKEPAAAAAIVLWLISFASGSLVGLPLLIREGWSMGELRRLARDEAAAEAAGKHVSLDAKPRSSVGSSEGRLR